MNSTTFGALALQLFNTSSIPAAALDEALDFRRLAQAMAAGDLTFAADNSEPAQPPEIASSEIAQ